MHEIERKFLVTQPLGEIIDPAAFHRNVEQCYLSDSGEWTVRARRYSSGWGIDWDETSMFMNAELTLKRKINDRKCIELESPITDETFKKYAKNAGTMLRKKRWRIMHEGHLWEIDYFPQFDGLVVAEIELKDEDEVFVRPEWLGQEVTSDKSYKNVRMAKRLK